MDRLLRPLPLLGIAFALRLVLALWTSTLAADGAYHLATAQGLLDGRFGELLGTYFLHPLNPILSAVLGAVLGGVEAGGAAAGVLCSSLAVLPLYVLARRLWSERIAGWTGLLYAVHPTLLDEGTEVLNTGAYLLFFLSALALGVVALESRRRLLFAAAGAACGLLYLVRPEGLLVPAFLVAMLACRLRSGGRRLLLDALPAVAAFLLVAAPYLLWLRGHAGRWTLTARQSAQALAGGTATNSPQEATTKPAYKILKTALKAEYPLLVPFLLVGLALHRRLGGARTPLAWAAALALATAAPSILLYLKSGTVPPSHRYFLPGVAVLLPWTAAGLLAAKDVACRAGWCLPAAVLAVLLAKEAGPRRAEERTFREAGTWIRSLGLSPDRALLARSEKMPWYAGLRHGWILFGRPEDALRIVLAARERCGAPYFALDGDTLQRYLPPGFEEALPGAGFERAASFERPGCVPVRVYRWKAAP